MMKNSKLIWIDIGTHFGQEYKSIFSNQTYFAWKLFRRFIGSKVFSRGKFLKISELAELFKNRKALRKNKNIFYFTFIEANPKIIAMKVYSEANDVFCLALAHRESRTGEITSRCCGALAALGTRRLLSGWCSRSFLLELACRPRLPSFFTRGNG